MIIDAHMHVKFKGFEAKNVIAYLDKYRVEQCWLLTWEEINPVIPKDYIHLSVEDVFETYEKYPSRVIPMYAPDPSAADFKDKMITWYQKGIKGCGELKVSLSWNSKEIDRLLTCISNLNIPLVFHMEGSRDCFISNSTWEHLLAKLFSLSNQFGQSRQMMNLITKICPPLKSKRNSMLCHFPGYLFDFIHLENRLIEHPQVAFIGHGPLFWKGIAADWIYDPSIYPKTPIKEEGVICNLLSKYDNLYADISGPSGFNALYRDRIFAKQFLTQYDQKILYGTDNFELGLKDFLRALNLAPKTYGRIYYENAVNLILN